VCLGFRDDKATISALIDGQLATVGGIALEEGLHRIAVFADVPSHHHAVLFHQLAIATKYHLMVSRLREELQGLGVGSGCLRRLSRQSQEQSGGQDAATNEIDGQQVDRKAIGGGPQARRYPKGTQRQQVDQERDEQQGQDQEVYGHSLCCFSITTHHFTVSQSLMAFY